MARIFLGVTDNDWFDFLKARNSKEVNFWKPSAGTFKAISANDILLFKLKSPRNCIAGGGFFVNYFRLPISLAWESFKEENGCSSVLVLVEKIKLRRGSGINLNSDIGCIVLTDVFYLDESDYVPIPKDWSTSIQIGKTYDSSVGEGAKLFQYVNDRLQAKEVVSTGERYTESMTKHRLGQGAFRVSVTEAYHRRCSISGEKTLPVLEAAHIIPYSIGGEHEVTNGILMRSDIHTLYDQGYLTIDTDFRVDVSKRLNEDFGNGKEYYKFHGKKLELPSLTQNIPDIAALEWHNQHVFLG